MTNFKYKKSLGQNFLHDSNIIEKIINLSEVDKDTFVIEIGPGEGALTKELAKSCGELICFEIDKRLELTLSKIEKDFNNVKIVYDDFLNINIDDYINRNYKKLYVVANLPYYITTPIIMKLIESKRMIDKIVIMIQKEVAERLGASPGTRQYNSLSAYISYYYNVNKLLYVSKSSFVPVPNVDSIVIELASHHKKFDVNDEDHLFKFLRDCFRYKRKNLKNNTTEYNQQLIVDVLSKHNLDLNIRAEQIPLELFIELSNKLTSK